jgi:Ca-activated chloride channel homolog
VIARALGIGFLTVAVLSVAAAQSAGPRVELSLIVTDKDNKPLTTIRKEDLHVFEGTVEQTILSVDSDTRPMDLVLAIDASGSFRPWFKPALDAAMLIIRNARPQDEICVERFISSEEIETVHDFSRDTKSLIKAIDSLYIEGGQSAIIDALYLAGDEVFKYNQGRADRRKVVVVLTDGEDRRSYYKPETLVNFVRARNVQIFALGSTAELAPGSAPNNPGPRERAEKLMKAVTEESGGLALVAKNEDDLLLNVTPQLLSLFRQQLVIKYQSSDASGRKGFRPVIVILDSASSEQRRAIAPHAYYFPTPVPSPEKKGKK